MRKKKAAEIIEKVGLTVRTLFASKQRKSVIFRIDVLYKLKQYDEV